MEITCNQDYYSTESKLRVRPHLLTFIRPHLNLKSHFILLLLLPLKYLCPHIFPLPYTSSMFVHIVTYYVIIRLVGFDLWNGFLTQLNTSDKLYEVLNSKGLFLTMNR